MGVDKLLQRKRMNLCIRFATAVESLRERSLFRQSYEGVWDDIVRGKFGKFPCEPGGTGRSPLLPFASKAASMTSCRALVFTFDPPLGCGCVKECTSTARRPESEGRRLMLDARDCPPPRTRD